MATRLDSVQLVVPRAVTDAQQAQHAAQRQPVVAQEHAAEHVKQDARVRERQPQAPQGATGGRVRSELAADAEIGERRDTRDRRRRRSLAGQPRSQDSTAARSAAPQPVPLEEARDTGDRGHFVDVRL